MVKRLINSTVFCWIVVSAAMAAGQSDKTLTSPDGRLTVSVGCEDGKPVYGIEYDGITFMKPSPLGLKTNVGDFTSGMVMSRPENLSSEKITADYSLPNIKKSHVDQDYTVGVYRFAKDDKTAFDVEFRVSDNDVAFRYILHPQGDALCAVVFEEATGFEMPDGTTTFLCPHSKPMTGFARTAPSYETSYTVDDATGKNGWGAGYTFPCLFRNGENGWLLLSETGVDGYYCASRLLSSGASGYRIGYPQEGEINGYGSVSPAVALPAEMPWRTVTLGRDLAPVVETTVPFDVVVPRYTASKDYSKVYGKGSWSWIIGMDDSCNYDEQKRYIDFSAAMGYGSVLVDALWDTRIGYDRMEELASYGKTKGVDLYLWYNSNGFWNDAPQSPRGIMHDSMKRRKEMAWMQKAGIRGIKVDFFGSDKQDMMKLYQDILTDANDYGLLVIFHGCTLPRGWEAMFPNYAASEAVLASENLHFSQGSCDAEAFNATLHPFIRNTVGSMDFGGSALNRYYNSANEPRGSKRVTSDVFALATAVLFQSPVQHFALAPNNLDDAPSWAMDFMKNVPTTWDDIKYIDGYPGKYVVIARRHGDKWYVAGVNAMKEPVKLEVRLPMMSAGDKLTLYTDNASLEGSVKDVKLNKKQTVSVTIPCNGGFVAVN